MVLVLIGIATLVPNFRSPTSRPLDAAGLLLSISGLALGPRADPCGAGGLLEPCRSLGTNHRRTDSAGRFRVRRTASPTAQLRSPTAGPTYVRRRQCGARVAALRHDRCQLLQRLLPARRTRLLAAGGGLGPFPSGARLDRGGAPRCPSGSPLVAMPRYHDGADHGGTGHGLPRVLRAAYSTRLERDRIFGPGPLDRHGDRLRDGSTDEYPAVGTGRRRIGSYQHRATDRQPARNRGRRHDHVDRVSARVRRSGRRRGGVRASGGHLRTGQDPLPSATDRHSFSGTTMPQAEALPPDILAAIARTAIEARRDLAVLNRRSSQNQPNDGPSSTG